jgi:hypothetical protein
MKHLRSWALLALLLLALWLDQVAPIAGPTVRAEPFSLTALFISLAFSAASYAINRIFGPKPPKVTKGQQSGELFIQNADEGSPLAEVYGAASSGNGQASGAITWAGVVNATVQADNSLLKNAGSDDCFTDASGHGDAGGRSVETFVNGAGDWEVSWNLGTTPSEGRAYVGLTTNASYPTGDFRNNLRYCIHISDQLNTLDPFPAHIIIVYENGSFKKVLGTPGNYTAYAPGDTLRIRSVGGVVTYWHKDTLIYTSALAPSYPLYFGASLACLNKTVDDVVMTQVQASTSAGGIKTAGTVIWCKPPRKVVTTEKQGGKGAPKQTVETITYYTDLAIAFGRGRQRLKKLWANADLIVDLTAAVGTPTGLVDSGIVSTTVYSTKLPPGPLTDPQSPFMLRVAGLIISGALGAGGAAMRWYPGDYEQLPDALIEADQGAGNAPAYRGVAMLVIENFNISKYGGVPTFLATVENADYDELDDIAGHLAERVGIEPGDRDFSPLAGQLVKGLIVKNPTAPRETLEYAAIPYQAEFYESTDGILTGTYFGGASVATIDANDLGMLEGDQVTTDGQGAPDKLQFNLVDEIQIPRQISVTAFDPSKNHETTTQHAYRMTGFSQGVEQMSLNMALTPDETRAAAERLLYQRHVERESALLRLPWRYSYLQPTDVVQVVSAGITHRLRIAQISGAMPGPLEVQAAADESAIYSVAVAGSSGSGYVAPTVSAPVQSLALLMDIVNLRDEDNSPGYYAAIAPRGAGEWKGAALYEDRGAGYSLIVTVVAPATAGVAAAALASADPAVWDYVNTIDLDLYAGGTLESATEAQVLNGANAALIGNEIIQFQTATQLGSFDNRWRLSNLLRGRRGSEYAVSTHATGERFVLLDGAVQFLAKSLVDRGVATNFKAVTAGINIADTPATSFTWDCQVLKPLSVVDVEGSRDLSNNLTITWIRRSRIGQETPYIDGGDPPLGEQSEAYEIDVMSGVTVKRTITATTTSASYSAADQTTDFGSPQSSLTVKIYQISASVGRGQVRQATV